MNTARSTEARFPESRGFWRRLRALARVRQHRYCVVLAGDRPWCRDRVGPLIRYPDANAFWVGEGGCDEVCPLPVGQARTLLGREIGLLVWEVRSGFDPDALGALAGTLRAGGLLVLLTPPLARWPAFRDSQLERLTPAGFDCPTQSRWISRLVNTIGADADVLVWEQPHPPPTVEPGPMPTVDAAPRDPLAECRTADQAAAVTAILSTATGHRDRPTVLTADRGRGKTSALGIAAARLLLEREVQIVLTAPRPAAVEAAFERASSHPQLRSVGAGELIRGKGSLRFLAPDALIRDRPAVGLLLVDEAAAIPTPLLETLRRRHHRIVFSTTIHGYEGSGRGFMVRFMDTLRRHCPHHRLVHMRQPVRWRAGDPLERLVSEALLLDAEPAAEEDLLRAADSPPRIEWLDRDDLVREDRLLRPLFGLLVQAHYRTTPLDLRHLLDGPGVALAAALHGDRVAGVVLVTDEGGFSPDLARAVWAGRRRPRGHLIPQSLAAHSGFEAAATLRCSRIVRVAVHPSLRRRGIGSALLAAVERRARDRGVDLIGASFGASPELLDFWSRNAQWPVRIGTRREASSGAHSVMVLKPVSASGAALVSDARARFAAELPRMLPGLHRDLEADLVVALLLLLSGPAVAIDETAWRNLAGFGYAARPYESSEVELVALVLTALRSGPAAAALTLEQQSSLVIKVLQQHPWRVSAERLALPGRRQVIDLLRAATRTLVSRLGDSELRRFARTLSGEAPE